MDANKAAEFKIEASVPNDHTVLTTEETENVFLCFNGDYTMENVILDCRQARFGILVKAGTVTLKNCHLIGDRSSSTGIGIFVTGKLRNFQTSAGSESSFDFLILERMSVHFRYGKMCARKFIHAKLCDGYHMCSWRHRIADQNIDFQLWYGFGN